jgi:signal transduction histidine kinase
MHLLVREEIFKPSFTTKPKGEGTGLGLAISRELINGMGGSLQLIDSDAKGSCFRIRLPVKEVV